MKKHNLYRVMLKNFKYYNLVSTTFFIEHLLTDCTRVNDLRYTSRTRVAIDIPIVNKTGQISVLSQLYTTYYQPTAPDARPPS